MMTLYNKTIYKKDTKGKIRFLTVQVLGEPDGELIQISGINETENPILHSKICKPKNLGKSNETSAHDQAVKEAEAIVKDKLTKGYFDNITDATSEQVILPMLAKEFGKESHKIDFRKEIWVQPKLDGMRCLAIINSPTNIVLMSRTGKEINNLDHIKEDLKNLSLKLNSSFPHILDGEVYAHGEDFQTNMEYIKKYRKGLTEKISFNIYDKVNPEDFSARVSSLAFIEGMCLGMKLNSLKFVRSHLITSLKDLENFNEAYLKAGYEGTMVRLGDSMYKINSRSSGLLKYKQFQDIALPIKDILPCKVMTDWGEPVFDWPGAKGHRSGINTLGCGTKLSHELRKDLLANKHKYIGKTAEIRFFEYSNTGVPRFPVMVGIRLDK